MLLLKSLLLFSTTGNYENKVLKINKHKNMRHQTLIELRSLLDDCLRKMTNDAYSNNVKYSFKIDWTKGTGIIQSPLGENITNYYVLRFYFIDKTESVVGNEVELSELYYSIKSDSTSEKQEEIAYKEFVLNGTRSMYNILYSAIWQQNAKEIICPENITDKDIIIDSIKQQANTPCNLVTGKEGIKSVNDLLKASGISIKPKGKA